ncbi:GNAT family N-acetyltransferase [Streptomyces kaniharaensis]|uniref:GNAT family N-acetyltransferase n=1 Tax=Streptomyces kaniharaensis TaxID=212423 RepID=A0A6N7KS10_9ACTN|nr:GNAT family N-acetyltransferase [Streptomyces kaniharaensis]MQS14412.1 GNAT family N-acetyltransferase [Streptomyces kaniharaensis]
MTTTLTIRDFRPDDAEAACAAHRAGREHLVMTAEALVWLNALELPGEHFRTFVAELDGQVVGSVRCALAVGTTTEGVGYANGSVLPRFRRRGAFTGLLAAAERHLTEHGATEVHAWVDDAPGSLAFARARGFTIGREAQFSERDLTLPLPEALPLPAGVELRPASDWAADPRPLFVVEEDASRDEPGEVVMDATEFEDWRRGVWSRPDLDKALSVVAVVDGEPAAFTMAQTDGVDRYWSAFTACRREFRGRGLSKLAKRESLRLAAAAGYRSAYTANDATNAPMLAVNAWLGYERCAGEFKGIKRLNG